MSVVQIDWNPDEAGYRKFGISVFTGFTLIGAAFWFFGGSFDETRETGRLVWGPLPWFTLIPLGVMLLALLAPRASRPLYLVWMGFAFVMGTIVSSVVLALIYWVLFGSLSLWFRLRGRDRLRLRRPAEGESTWTAVGEPPPRERYARQF